MNCKRLNLEARILNAALHNKEVKELLKKDYCVSRISHRYKMIFLENNNKDDTSFALATYTKQDKPKMYKIVNVIPRVVYEESIKEVDEKNMFRHII